MHLSGSALGEFECLQQLGLGLEPETVQLYEAVFATGIEQAARVFDAGFLPQLQHFLRSKAFDFEQFHHAGRSLFPQGIQLGKAAGGGHAADGSQNALPYTLDGRERGIVHRLYIVAGLAQVEGRRGVSLVAERILLVQLGQLGVKVQLAQDGSVVHKPCKLLQSELRVRCGFHRHRGPAPVRTR